MNRKLTDNELSVICEVIASRTGLYFPSERWEVLGKNLVKAAGEFGFRDMTGFIQWLISTDLTKDQIEILASHLTVSETYFWREPAIFKALTNFVMPELIKSKKKKGRNITIWSAGCSTGEEPYSVAIAIHKTIPDLKTWPVNIIATDINRKALAKAGKGIYTSWSFRNSPDWLKTSYFIHHSNNTYEIIPEIRKMVAFTGFNLNDDNYLSTVCNNRKIDIILCRNVLMYFTDETAVKVSQNLSHSLSEDGWLIVSSCELSSQLFPELNPVNFPDAIVYRQTRKNSVQSIPVPSLSAGIPDVEDLQLPDPISSPPCPSIVFAKEDNVSSNIVEQSVSDIIGNRETDSRSNLTERYKDPETDTIRFLADTGNLAEALTICDKALLRDKLHPGLYFLKASILQEMNKNKEAIQSLKQAVYIDPDYIMGHFSLGNLFASQGNKSKAKLHFDNVLSLLKNFTDNDFPEGSEGLTVKHIREIIYSNKEVK